MHMHIHVASKTIRQVLYLAVKCIRHHLVFYVEDNSRRLKLGNYTSFYSERRRENK
jgi:hypothetical protein